MNANSSVDTGAEPTSGSQHSSDAQSRGESKFDRAMEAMREGSEPKQQGKPQKEELSEKKDDTPLWEQRYKDLQADRDRAVSQAYQKAEKMAIEKIKADPAYIHTLAEEDREFCDRVIKNDPECQELGIKNYDDILAYIQKQKMPEETRAIAERIDKLEGKLTEKEQKEIEEAQKKAELFVSQFKEQHPDFKGEFEKQCWTLFDNSKLSLDECYEFMKWKSGQEEDINQREERAFMALKQKEVAGAIPSTSSRSGRSGSNKNISKQDIEFLEGIGAKKSLQKHGY